MNWASKLIAAYKGGVVKHSTSDLLSCVVSLSLQLVLYCCAHAMVAHPDMYSSGGLDVIPANQCFLP